MGVVVARSAGGTAAVLIAAAAALLPVPARAGDVSVSHERFYQAAVNVPPDAAGADGFAGSVLVHLPLGGQAWVELALTRSWTVTCPDGEEGTASLSIGSPGVPATVPGPVTLEVDRRLLAARGEAVIDVDVTEDPGCGAEPVTRTEPAVAVSVDVAGTSPLFTTGVGGSTRSGADGVRDLARDLSRDGTGTVRVGSWLDVRTDAAFLRYGVVRSHRQGTPPPAPGPAAPPGGRGAQADFAESFAPDGPGLLFTDALVQVGTTPPPSSATTVQASALRVTRVACTDGSHAEVVELLAGAGPGSLAVGRSLESASASATVRMRREVSGGCDPGAEPTVAEVDVPVTLDLTATGPEVRVRDVRWHGTRGGDVDRTRDWYLAREAAGTVAVGESAGATGTGSIARASR